MAWYEQVYVDLCTFNKKGNFFPEVDDMEDRYSICARIEVANT